MRDSPRPVIEALEAEVDHLRGPSGATPTLFIDGVVHRGNYDTETLLAALG